MAEQFLFIFFSDSRQKSTKPSSSSSFVHFVFLSCFVFLVRSIYVFSSQHSSDNFFWLIIRKIWNAKVCSLMMDECILIFVVLLRLLCTFLLLCSIHPTAVGLIFIAYVQSMSAKNEAQVHSHCVWSVDLSSGRQQTNTMDYNERRERTDNDAQWQREMWMIFFFSAPYRRLVVEPMSNMGLDNVGEHDKNSAPPTDDCAIWCCNLMLLPDNRNSRCSPITSVIHRVRVTNILLTITHTYSIRIFFFLFILRSGGLEVLRWCYFFVSASFFLFLFYCRCSGTNFDMIANILEPLAGTFGRAFRRLRAFVVYEF